MIRRQQIRRELNPVKVGIHTLGQCLDSFGLGQPRGALYKKMTIGEQGDHQSLYQMFLADNFAGQPVLELIYILVQK